MTRIDRGGGEEEKRNEQWEGGIYLFILRPLYQLYQSSVVWSQLTRYKTIFYIYIYTHTHTLTRYFPLKIIYKQSVDRRLEKIVKI